MKKKKVLSIMTGKYSDEQVENIFNRAKELSRKKSDLLSNFIIEAVQEKCEKLSGAIEQNSTVKNDNNFMSDDILLKLNYLIGITNLVILNSPYGNINDKITDNKQIEEYVKQIEGVQYAIEYSEEQLAKDKTDRFEKVNKSKLGTFYEPKKETVEKKRYFDDILNK